MDSTRELFRLGLINEDEISRLAYVISRRLAIASKRYIARDGFDALIELQRIRQITYDDIDEVISALKEQRDPMSIARSPILCADEWTELIDWNV